MYDGGIDYAFGAHPGLRWRGRVIEDQGGRIKVQQFVEGQPEGKPFWTDRRLLTGTWKAEEVVRDLIKIEQASWNKAPTKLTRIAESLPAFARYVERTIRRHAH